MDPDLPLRASTLLVTGAAAGVALHQVVKRIEIDRFPLSFLGFLLGSTVILAQILSNVSPRYEDFWSAFRASRIVLFGAIISLLVNVLIYRAFFHPLNNFPGPFGAKLSKFWALSQVVKSNIKWYQVTGRLHDEYGDYVRTGPRELLIFTVEAIKPLYGPLSKARKGPFYGGIEQSLHTTRDHDWHRQRRKVWDMAFKQTLVDYGSAIEEFTETLLEVIESKKGTPIMINSLCINYSFDVASAVGFNGDTKFLTGKSTKLAAKVFDGIHTFFSAIGALLHTPWLLSILTTFSVAGPMAWLSNWSSEQVEARKKMKLPKPDIIGHLLKHTENDCAGRKLLMADTRLIIGAGSDTTAAALSVIFILLSIHRDYQQQLRTELEISFKDGSYTCENPQLLLDAIINEALRVYPPVSFGSQRVIPETGMTIGDVTIPPGTVVSIDMYHLHRDRRNFVDPESFIPERWTSRPEMILNRDAFIPFSTGPYNCAGKNLALMELRSVVARTVYNYEFRLADPSITEDKKAFAGLKDHFTLGIPQRELVFTKRAI